MIERPYTRKPDSQWLKLAPKTVKSSLATLAQLDLFK